MTSVPTGATSASTFVEGVALSGGWGTVRDNALARPASRLEKLFATTTVQQDGSTAAKAATLATKDENGTLIEGRVLYTVFVGL